MYELDTLANTAGVWSEQEKVTKLWDGLQLAIQQQLWREKLSAEYSSWEEIIMAAENEELALSLTENSHCLTQNKGTDKVARSTSGPRDSSRPSKGRFASASGTGKIDGG